MLSSLILPSNDYSSDVIHNDQSSPEVGTRKFSTVSIPNDVSARLIDLEHENDVLRRQLEKIGKMDGLAIEQSCRNHPVCQDQFSYSGGKEIHRLRTENFDLIERLHQQAEDIMAMKQERESLLLTIQLLQDDLTSSERQRQRQLTPT